MPCCSVRARASENAEMVPDSTRISPTSRPVRACSESAHWSWFSVSRPLATRSAPSGCQEYEGFIPSLIGRSRADLEGVFQTRISPSMTSYGSSEATAAARWPGAQSLELVNGALQDIGIVGVGERDRGVARAAEGRP